MFSDIPRGLGMYSCWKKTALRPDRLGRWLEWRPEGLEGWGQRSPVGVGQSAYVCWVNGPPLTSIALDSTHVGACVWRSEDNFRESALAIHFEAVTLLLLMGGLEESPVCTFHLFTKVLGLQMCTSAFGPLHSFHKQTQPVWQALVPAKPSHTHIETVPRNWGCL